MVLPVKDSLPNISFVCPLLIREKSVVEIKVCGVLLEHIPQ